MPFVNLSWDVKTTKEKKRELMNFITDTIADLTSTDKNRIYVFIRDYDEENVGSPSCPVVQIDWVDLPARTPEVKAEKYLLSLLAIVRLVYAAESIKKRRLKPSLLIFSLMYLRFVYTIPCSIIAFATFSKPAMLAPFTRSYLP